MNNKLKQKILLKCLYKLLKKYDCLESYLTYMQLHCNNWNNYAIEKLLCNSIKTTPRSMVNGFFIWNDTSEGHNFWSLINDEWGKIYYKL